MLGFRNGCYYATSLPLHRLQPASLLRLMSVPVYENYGLNATKTALTWFALVAVVVGVGVRVFLGVWLLCFRLFL